MSPVLLDPRRPLAGLVGQPAGVKVERTHSLLVGPEVVEVGAQVFERDPAEDAEWFSRNLSSAVGTPTSRALDA